MLEALKPILAIQDLDIKMIRLMRVKKQRQKELVQIEALRGELKDQLKLKEEEIAELDKQTTAFEEQIQEKDKRLKELESKQAQIKKVDEFNAMTQQITEIEREKIALEQEASNLIDRKSAEEEIYEKIKSSLDSSDSNSQEIEQEIKNSIDQINQEGQELKKKRDALAKDADPSILAIYERLLRNKKDQVIVPIQDRTCSGCHIALTIQHENLVRKGENLAFCEHCSRLHYWPTEEAAIEGEAAPTRRRRRRANV